MSSFDDDVATLDALVRELEAKGALPLALPAADVFSLAATVQWVLRHPPTADGPRAALERFLATARVFFADCPTVLEALRRGDDARQDRRL